jgi:hypothetical protein
MKSPVRANAKATKGFSAGDGFGVIRVKLWTSTLNPDRAVLLRRRRCGSNALPLEWLQYFFKRSRACNFGGFFCGLKKKQQWIRGFILII